MRLAIVLCLALCGCATDQAFVKTQTVEVKVPVRVPCIDAADVPKLPERTKVSKDATEKQLDAAVAAYVTAYEDYGPKADALMRACSK